MTKEEDRLYKRIKELSEIAYNRNIITHTDFLNLNELSLFQYTIKDFSYIKYELHGGYSEAERRIIRFEPDYVNDIYPLPISCIRIVPINKKFSDELSHRDFLGAVLNLGIDRCKIGDILTCENIGYIFCISSISTFIADTLTKVKHTNVLCNINDNLNIEDFKPRFNSVTGTVSSERLDAVLSLAFSKSRSSISGLIESGKVFVNSKLIESNHYMLKENDIVSVRGYGKFVYIQTGAKTKKGRYTVTLHKYV